MNIHVPPDASRVSSPTEQIQRVMLVDDHEVFRVGMRNLLTDMVSFEVLAEASTCADALARMQSSLIDVVLLDLHLPDVEGVEAVHRLKAEPNSPDVIILSATIDDETLLDALTAGVAGYITKDTSALEILDALRQYKRGELAMTSTIFSRAIRLMMMQNQQLDKELTLYRQHALEVSTRGIAQEGSTPLSSAYNVRLSLPQLTPQEEKVYQLMRRGQSNKQIAADLYISRFTVGKHVQNILRKMGVTNRTQAVSYTLLEGDIDQ